jgi:hypothetical protein
VKPTFLQTAPYEQIAEGFGKKYVNAVDDSNRLAYTVR